MKFIAGLFVGVFGATVLWLFALFFRTTRVPRSEPGLTGDSRVRSDGTSRVPASRVSVHDLSIPLLARKETGDIGDIRGTSPVGRRGPRYWDHHVDGTMGCEPGAWNECPRCRDRLGLRRTEVLDTPPYDRLGL